LQPGDIIVVRSGAYTGDSALVTQNWSGAIAGYDMVMRIHQRATAPFVAYAFLCQHIVEAQMNPLRLRAAQPHLNAEELGDVVVILPPLDEQQEIVAHIQSETQKMESLIAATRRTILLLKERRVSLIAEAVTGKISAGLLSQ
jgi:type I restriction enzyme S subunit